MGFRDEITGTLGGSTAVTVPMLSVAYPATVAIVPGNGDSVLCEYSVVDGTWTAWANGTATSASVDVLDAAVKALRFTRTAGTGTASAYSILPRRG